MRVPSNWFEEFFHGVTLDLWRKAVPTEQTKGEAEFLNKNLGCEPGARVLDVPCGNGRLSFELAQRGYQVTGVDISEEFVEEARLRAVEISKAGPPATAGASDKTTRLQIILGDMRRVEG